MTQLMIGSLPVADPRDEKAALRERELRHVLRLIEAVEGASTWMIAMAMSGRGHTTVADFRRAACLIQVLRRRGAVRSVALAGGRGRPVVLYHQPMTPGRAWRLRSPK